MPKLDPSKISSHSIKSLATIKIYSTLDFILADVESIVSNSDLNAEDVLSLKHQFITNNSSVPINGYDYYLSVKNNGFIKTHIIGLDRLLDGGLMKGSILELCGPVSCGKTQLCHSIAVNTATCNARVDYIDTKFEFSASRCNNLLPTNLNDQEMDRILENINVYNAKNIYHLMTTVEALKEKYKNFTESNKIIIIDSMTAPYLPLVGLTTNKGLSLLSYIASSLKDLASSYKAAVVITNLGVKYFEEDEEHKRSPREIKPLLGKFWLHVPNTRILINRENFLTSKRSLCIQKSDYIHTSKIGEISITETGVT